MSELQAEGWRRCSACKASIGFSAAYWACNVSTCNRKRTALYFCSVECWEVHLPTANHRESWAVEKRAPSRQQASAEAESAENRPSEAVMRARRSPSRAPAGDTEEPQLEVLIVANRLKAYVRARSGMNTSEGVLEPLSDIVREACEEAIRSARRDGRKTVLARDLRRR